MVCSPLFSGLPSLLGPSITGRGLMWTGAGAHPGLLSYCPVLRLPVDPLVAGGPCSGSGGAFSRLAGIKPQQPHCSDYNVGPGPEHFSHTVLWGPPATLGGRLLPRPLHRLGNGSFERLHLVP